jgi:adenosylhomocysteine nucleosidase
LETDIVTTIVMATMLEAKPFVLGMSLRQTEKVPFRLFQNEAVLLIISGIGKANAAMATAYVCLKYKPLCIFNLGAAGTTHSGYDLGEIFHIQKIVELDRPDLKTGKPCVHQPDLLAGFKTTILATSDRAVLDPKERKAISITADLIDMEGASVVQACTTFQKHCYLFKFVSDTPEHTRDQDIVDHIRRYRKTFYDFFADSVRPMLPGLDI